MENMHMVSVKAGSGRYITTHEKLHILTVLIFSTSFLLGGLVPISSISES